MQVKNLLIERKNDWEDKYKNQIVGIVQIEGDHGKMEVKLSNLIVSKIFALIKEDVQRVANYNSSQASHAVSEAENEMTLLENDKGDPELLGAEPF